MNKKALAEWLIQKREQAELTQPELAERAGCGKANISKIETRRSTPPLDTLVKLCRALGVSLIEPLTVMGYLKPQPQPEPHVLRMLHYYQNLQAADQKLAEELIKTLWRERGDKENTEKPAKRKPA